MALNSECEVYHVCVLDQYLPFYIYDAMVLMKT